MKKKLSKQELALKKIAVAQQAYINEHINNTSNPHSVTKTQVGLSNVTNDSQVKRSEMGANNGVATLGADGKVPSSQLPSYTLDNVLDGLNRKIPTKVSELTNDSGFLTGHQSLVDYATKTFVENKFKDAFGINASGVSDLAAILSDEDYTTGILNVIANKVDKVSGKGLSTNDYTTTEKNKLSGIESGAQVHIAPTTTEVKSALGTGSGTSKYLREDGTWVTPPNDNTTYKLTINSIDNGGGSTSLGSIYAPTSAGTSGQILTSSGNGAPTWSAAPAAATIKYTTVDEDVTDINANAVTQIATLNANALLKTSQSLTSGEQSQILTNLGISSLNANALLKTSQNLTSGEQSQVLINLGISAVLLKTSQNLSSAEKSQVLTNLGIASVRNITISTSEPTSSDGSDGDVWLVYEA